MEHEHTIDQFIDTGAGTEKIGRLEKKIQTQFEQQDAREIKSIEREKTDQEKWIIEQVNNDLNTWRSRFGLPIYEAPETIVHIIPSENWKSRSGGETVPLYQEVAIADDPEPLVVAERIHHELTHVHSYTAIDAGPTRVQDYRLGLSGYTRPDHQRYHNILNEGVTAELTRQFMMHLREDAAFKAQRTATENVFAHVPEATDRAGEPIFQDDVYMVEAKPIGENQNQLVAKHIAYREERRAVLQLLKHLEKKTGAPSEQTLNELFRSMFTGNLLTTGKRIDRAFGRGAFRRLAVPKTLKDFQGVVTSLVES